MFANVYAEKYSGGTNKLFRNYSLRENSILMVTADTLIKAKNHQVGLQTAIIVNIEASPSSHPYESALERYWQERFPNFSSMYGILRLHDIVSRLSWNEQAKLEIFGVATDRRKALVQFLESNSLTGSEQDIHSQSTE
jgi:hypothetical protein